MTAAPLGTTTRPRFTGVHEILNEVDGQWKERAILGQLVLSQQRSWAAYTPHVREQAGILISLDQRVQELQANSIVLPTDVVGFAAYGAIEAQRGLEELGRDPHSRFAAFMITRLNCDINDLNMSPIAFMALRYTPDDSGI